MPSAEQFRSDVDAFLARTGMKPSRFGKLALGDPNFVSDLRSGRDPRLGLADRIYRFMREQEENSQSAA